MIDSLEYNTERTGLIIPEYGRHIQKMVDQAINCSDKKERNKMAKAIIGVMGNLNPHLRDVPDFQHKLWDQLFIMSGFNLDVDSPFAKPSKEIYEEKPEKLNYPQNHPRYRFYGNNIKKMIDVATSWEDGEMKKELIYVIANHMKKCFLKWNKDSVDDVIIFNHILELSNGKIKIDKDSKPLTESKDLISLSAKKFSKSSKKGKKPYRNFKRK
ncbi:MAG: methionyl-tRNA formyltransferase [Flavobacteriales bacterium]|nr:methionyl-tRNA formyltransferase [Flavobacteriales bacterium]